jgi:hypothetical protein
MKVKHPVKLGILTVFVFLILAAVLVHLFRHPLHTKAKNLVPPLAQVDTVEIWHSGKTIKLEHKTDIEQIYRLLDCEVKRNFCPDNGILWHSAGSPLEFVHFAAGKRTYYLGVETNQNPWNNYRYTESSSTYLTYCPLGRIIYYRNKLKLFEKGMFYEEKNNCHCLYLCNRIGNRVGSDIAKR